MGFVFFYCFLICVVSLLIMRFIVFNVVNVMFVRVKFIMLIMYMFI